MKRLSLTVAALVALAAPALAQPSYRVITRPKIPSNEVIERLGLAFNWHAKVELDGARDAIHSVQIIPRGTGTNVTTEIVVQTLAGAVSLFDGETGALRWTTPIPFRYNSMQPAAYNSQSIFVTRRNWLYVLNRDTGIQRVYKKSNGERNYGFLLDNMPSAAPAASDDMVVLAFPDKVSAFSIPNFKLAAAARERDASLARADEEGSLQPLPDWNYYDPTMKLSTSPVITPSQVSVTTADGRVVSLALGLARSRVRYEFKTLANLTAPMAHHGDYGYIGGEDYNLYALNLAREQLLWRFASGAPILRKPEVNDADVFLTSKGRGMYRVSRFAPEAYWLEPVAERFLAANYYKDAEGKFKLDDNRRVLAKYVYAVDKLGKLLVLDGDRGGVLAQYDTSDWQTPVSNEWTDRIYFANNDGQVLCLRPRDSRSAQLNKSIDAPRPGGGPRPGAAMPAMPAVEMPAMPAPPAPMPVMPDKKDEK